MESRNPDIRDEGSRPVARTRRSPWGLARASAELVPRGARDLVDLLCENAIAIMNEEAVGMTARQRFPELLERPFRRRMGRNVLVDDPAGSNLYDDEDVESTERGRDHHEEVAGHHGLGMVTEEGQPALFWGPACAPDRPCEGTCRRCAGRPECSA